MLQLLLFVPCEKAIISQPEGLLTLVSVFERINTEIPSSIPTGVSPSEGTAIPLTWFVVAVWRCDTDYLGNTFEQRVRLIQPNGKVILDSITPITMSTISHRSILQVEGFVVKPPGDYALQMEIKEPEKGNRWRVVGKYPLIVSTIETPEVAESV